MHVHYFSLEEAQALLPRVREIMLDVRELKRRADTHMARARMSANPVDQALGRGQAEFLIRDLNRRLEDLCELGCLPKDIDQGLVDFPTRIPEHGEAYLCWRLGESDITAWHPITEGYSGRRPLPEKVPVRRRAA